MLVLTDHNSEKYRCQKPKRKYAFLEISAIYIYRLLNMLHVFSCLFVVVS